LTHAKSQNFDKAWTEEAMRKAEQARKVKEEEERVSREERRMVEERRRAGGANSVGVKERVHTVALRKRKAEEDLHKVATKARKTVNVCEAGAHAGAVCENVKPRMPLQQSLMELYASC
jgi:hypothetical protein